MKTLLYSTLFLLVISAFSKVRAQGYKTAFKEDLCDCLSQKEMNIRQYSREYQRCFMERLPRHVARIEASLPDTTARARLSLGSKLKQELRLGLQSELAGSCDSIIGLYARKHNDDLLSLQKAADSLAFVKANQGVALSPNLYNLVRRAMVYIGQDKLELASRDVEAALELSPKSRDAKLLKVVILERKKEYAEAIALLKEVSIGPYDRDINMHAAYLEYLQGQ